MKRPEIHHGDLVELQRPYHNLEWVYVIGEPTPKNKVLVQGGSGKSILVLVRDCRLVSPYAPSEST